jgi:hypothetical protein
LAVIEHCTKYPSDAVTDVVSKSSPAE